MTMSCKTNNKTNHCDKPSLFIKHHKVILISLGGKENSSGISWSHHSTSNNKLCHSLSGNRGAKGYKLAVWNCNRGLLCQNGEVQPKLVDVKRYIEKHSPHCLGIIETDIHGPRSRVHRRNNLTTEELREKLEIPGYSFFLPETWQHYDQARLVVYVSDQVKATVMKQRPEDYDLPVITLELGLGRGIRKTRVNYYYREWASGVAEEPQSTSRSLPRQRERLERLITHWSSLPGQQIVDVVKT